MSMDFGPAGRIKKNKNMNMSLNLATLILNYEQGRDAIAASLQILAGGKEYEPCGSPIREWAKSQAALWAGWLTQPTGSNQFTELAGDGGSLTCFYALEKGAEEVVAPNSAFEETRSLDKVIKITLTRPNGESPFFFPLKSGYGVKQDGELKLRHHCNVSGKWSKETGYAVVCDGIVLGDSFSTKEDAKVQIRGICGIAVSTPTNNKKEEEHKATSNLAEEPVEFTDDFADRVLEMDAAELRSRVLCQRDYIKRFYMCLDGLPIPRIRSYGIDGYRDHQKIRRIVEALLHENSTPSRRRGSR